MNNKKIKNNYTSITDDELLTMVKAEIEKIGSTTFESFYKNKSDNIPSFSYIQKRFNLKWNDLLERLNLEINLKNMTNEELIQQLKDIANEMGQTPSINELIDRGINTTIYHTRFGSYNNALELAGLDINFERGKVTHTNDELVEMYIDLSNRLGKAATQKDIDEHLEYNSDVFAIRFGSINKLREIAGYEQINYTKKYTKKNIKTMLIKEYRRNNRRLTNKELTQLSKENKGFPGISTICRHFKTTKMSEVWEEVEKTEKDRLDRCEELLEQVKKLANELGKTPTVNDFEFSGRAMYLFGGWNNFIIQAGLKPNQIIYNFDNIEKEELLKIVEAELKRIGTTKCSVYQKHKNENAPSRHLILKLLKLNNWQELLKLLGMKQNIKPRKIKIKAKAKCKVEYCEENAKSKGYCSRHYQQIKRLGFIKEEKTEEEKQLHLEKMRNSKVRIDNILGVKGVRLVESGKYQARIAVDYNEKHLGTFDTLEEAIEARINGEIKYWGKAYSDKTPL